MALSLRFEALTEGEEQEKYKGFASPPSVFMLENELGCPSRRNMMSLTHSSHSTGFALFF